MPPREPACSPAGRAPARRSAVARALAGLKGGDVLVLVPTVEKAEELKEEIERHRPARMFTVRLVRPHPAGPRRTSRPNGTDGERAFLDFNRRQLERMCGRPKELIEDAQRAGVEMGRTFCPACPMRLDCLYLGPARHHQERSRPAHRHRRARGGLPADAVLRRPRGRRRGHRDQGRPGGRDRPGPAARPREVAGTAPERGCADRSPARSPRRWPARARSWPPCARPASRRRHLKACAAHLRRPAPGHGRGDRRGRQGRRLGADARATWSRRSSARSCARSRCCSPTCATRWGPDAAGTNATRLVRGRRKRVKDADGNEREERLDRYVVSRPRRHGFGEDKELILLDGTGSLGLNRRLFGEDVRGAPHRGRPAGASRSRSRRRATASTGSCCAPRGRPQPRRRCAA